MLDSIINDMRIIRLMYQEEYPMNDLLDTIKKHIQENIDILERSFELEYQQSLDTNRLLHSFDLNSDNKVGIIDAPFTNEYGKVANNYVPYGIVGVVVKNDISFYQYASIISLLIQTKNSIILEPFHKMGTINILIEMINSILLQIQGIPRIEINTSGETLKENRLLDLLLFIGSKNEYRTISTFCHKLYYGIGDYELILDKEIDSHLIEEAKKRNVILIDKDKEEDFYSRFNASSSNYCTAIMTDSKEEARKFIANVKASYVFVNALPTLVDDINIDINDLIYKKSTLIGGNHL